MPVHIPKESSTKFEGSFVPHTFVARLASDPNIVIDSYTVQPTKVIDCPMMKQKESLASSEDETEIIVGAEENIQPLEEELAAEVATGRRAAVMAKVACRPP